MTQKRGVLHPEVTREARQWLTGDLDIINSRVIEICAEQTQRASVPIEKLRVSVKRSWEEEFNELVLQVFVKTDFPKSLALWDVISDSVQHWGNQSQD